MMNHTFNVAPKNRRKEWYMYLDAFMCKIAYFLQNKS